jgi:hypothetical protein
MKETELEHALYRILYATEHITYNGENYTSVPNTLQDKYLSTLVYNRVIEDIKFEDFLSWEQAKKVSARLSIWTEKDDESLKGLEKFLENAKLDLFLSHANPVGLEKKRKTISSLKKGIIRSNNNKYKLYHMTKEHHAEQAVAEFLAAVSLRDDKGMPVYNMHNYTEADHQLINVVLEKKNQIIDNELLRKIARSEPWRSMWNLQKSEAIGKPSAEWTDYQRMLCSYSKMYDNVYESMECPSDEVIEDDDMLDGWFTKQKQDREKARKEKAMDDKFGKFKDQDGQELFIAARPDDVKDVYSMNDAKGRGIIKSRNKQIEQQGAVKHGHLKDVQMDLHMQKTQEMRETMRRR